jgi:hypothetical protein
MPLGDKSSSRRSKGSERKDRAKDAKGRQEDRASNALLCVLRVLGATMFSQTAGDSAVFFFFASLRLCETILFSPAPRGSEREDRAKDPVSFKPFDRERFEHALGREFW